MKQRTATIAKVAAGAAALAFTVWGISAPCPDGPAGSKPQTTQVAQPQPNKSTLACMEGKRVVHEGERLFTEISQQAALSSSFAYSISKIDDRGIELVMDMEILSSEHASNRASPRRINYGEPGRIGEGALMLTVKAERGTEPGTAMVDVTCPPAMRSR